MVVKELQELLAKLDGAVELHEDQIRVKDEILLRDKIDGVVYQAVFAEELNREVARWILWEIGLETGVYAASIHELYMAAGRGELSKRFTVPAINVRAMNYNTSRAIFRAANKLKVGALIFEIARSEMGYTDQRPAEYVSAVIGAAIKEGFRGPLFIQGDHFQVSAKGFLTDPKKEIDAVKNLIVESIEAGFYNIDIDTSTLVDLDQDSLDEQQRNNYHLCAEFTHFVREIEPERITVSLGGEIGEVGGHNSTVPELHAFMRGYQNETEGIVGISKISVQTGTSHGGVVLPDGTLAQVRVDFKTLKELSDVSRTEFGIGGAVQHGASTLPPSAFNNFPQANAIEIHLATGFQNIIYDMLPDETVNQAYNYLQSSLKNEWKEGQTEDQFLYSARKKAIGPFKKEWWNLEPDVQISIGRALQEQFEFLFEMLEVSDTREITQKNTPEIKIHRQIPSVVTVQDDLEIAVDLAD